MGKSSENGRGSFDNEARNTTVRIATKTRARPSKQEERWHQTEGLRTQGERAAGFSVGWGLSRRGAACCIHRSKAPIPATSDERSGCQFAPFGSGKNGPLCNFKARVAELHAKNVTPPAPATPSDSNVGMLGSSSKAARTT